MSQSNTGTQSNPIAGSVKKVQRTRLDKTTLRLIIFAFALPMLLVSILMYSAETIVSGIEFNANTWQMRSFSFRRDPFSGRQLTGVEHDSSTSTPALPSVRPYFKSTNSHAATARWDLVRISAGTTSVRKSGPAAILLDYLSASDPKGNPFWDSWTKSSPNKAAILWPAVQDLVLLDLYSDLPSMFEKTVVDFTDDEFRHEIHFAMLAILRDKALMVEKVGELPHAVRLARVGLAYGDDAELSRITNRDGTPTSRDSL